MTITLQEYLKQEGIEQISDYKKMRELERGMIGDEVSQRLDKIINVLVHQSGDLIPYEREMYQLLYRHNLFQLTDAKNVLELELILPYLQQRIQGHSKVLDVGCGDGLKTTYLAINNPQTSFVAFDISSEALQRLQERLKKHRCQNVYPVQGNLLSLPFNQIFDFVLVSNMIHESGITYDNYYDYGLPTDENMPKKFQSLVKTLKSRGILLISHANCLHFATMYATLMESQMSAQDLQDINEEYLEYNDGKILEISGVKL